MKFLFALLLLLPSCGSRMVQYQPRQDSRPLETIERLLRSQAPVYNSVPYYVSVENDCFQVRSTKQHTEGPTTICYKNIGRIDLFKWDVYWHVELYDRTGGGGWLYGVYFYDEADAKGLIDALYTMKGLPK
jgi:hypothetical protein